MTQHASCLRMRLVNSILLFQSELRTASFELSVRNLGHSRKMTHHRSDDSLRLRIPLHLNFGITGTDMRGGRGRRRHGDEQHKKIFAEFLDTMILQDILRALPSVEAT
jgi:hypothetical protein